MPDFHLISNRFGEVQESAQALAIGASKDTILLSNLQKVELIRDPSAYLMSAIDKIEESPSFKEFDQEIEQYLNECHSQADLPYLDSSKKKQDERLRQGLKEIRKAIKSARLRLFEGYDIEDRPSHLRTWLRITDFYEQKILNGDTSDWTPKLIADLKEYPAQLGQKHCFVALDGIYGPGIHIKEARTVYTESPEMRILNRIRIHSKHARYFASQYVAYLGIRPANIKLDLYHYLYRPVVCRGGISLPYLREEVLGKQTTALMLAAKDNVSAPNLFVVPESRLDGHDIEFNASQDAPSCLWEIVADPLYEGDALAFIDSHTVHESEEDVFGTCCETLLAALEQMHTKRKTRSLQIPVFLYVEACEAHEEVLSFLLFCTSLESLLIGRSETELREKFATRLALLIGSSEKERVSLYSEAREIYRLRSNLAHGSKPEEALKPYQHTSKERMRELARQSIIAALTLTAILDGSDPQLQVQLNEALGKQVGTWRKVLEGLHEHLFDNRASDMVLNAMRTWWQKRAPSAAKIMGLKFLEPSA